MISTPRPASVATGGRQAAAPGVPSPATGTTCTGRNEALHLGLIAEILMRTYFESQGKTPYAILRRVNFPESGPQTPELRPGDSGQLSTG
jgi:hypothetical protein